MAAPRPPVTPDDVAAACAGAFVGPALGRVGLEVEWIVVDGTDPRRPVPAAEVEAAVAGALPAGGRVSFEPGGQLELSTPPRPGPAAACDAADEDEAELRRRAAGAGLRLVAVGVDPLRLPRRSVDTPRYRALEAAFDRDGPAGRAMMASTASLQVDVDFGPDPLETAARASAVSGVLAAAFANAPFRAGRRSADQSARARIWSRVDPRRAGPARLDPAGWTAYALAAPVTATAADGPRPGSVTLARWLAGGGPGRRPDHGDVATHLTTLFPPVRPRGHLECRFFDTLPAGWRRLAVTVLTTLLGVPLEPLASAVAGLGPPWATAAGGLRPPAVRRGALALATLAAETADDAATADAIGSWRDGALRAGITPAGLTAAAMSCPTHAPCPAVVASASIADPPGGAPGGPTRPLRHARLAVLGQGPVLSP